MTLFIEDDVTCLISTYKKSQPLSMFFGTLTVTGVDKLKVFLGTSYFVSFGIYVNFFEYGDLDRNSQQVQLHKEPWDIKPPISYPLFDILSLSFKENEEVQRMYYLALLNSNLELIKRCNEKCS